MDEALQLLVVFAAKVEKAGFRNGGKTSPDGLDAKTDKDVFIFDAARWLATIFGGKATMIERR